MGMVDRIKYQAKKRGYSLTELAEELQKKGVNIGLKTIYTWDKNSPSLDKIRAVAEFLNVSVDYLLEIEDTKETDLERLLESDSPMMYGGDQLTDEQKRQVKAVLRALIEEHKE